MNVVWIDTLIVNVVDELYVFVQAIKLKTGDVHTKLAGEFNLYALLVIVNYIKSPWIKLLTKVHFKTTGSVLLL